MLPLTRYTAVVYCYIVVHVIIHYFSCIVLLHNIEACACPDRGKTFGFYGLWRKPDFIPLFLDF